MTVRKVEEVARPCASTWRTSILPEMHEFARIFRFEAWTAAVQDQIRIERRSSAYAGTFRRTWTCRTPST